MTHATRVELDAADRRFLERAAELGRRGWGRVHCGGPDEERTDHPNPMVGCVLVRGGRVLAEAWHREFGGPHAEALALEEAGEDTRGATAYVSLEPCRHQGKTPACTAALVRAGVRRVVFGAPDPTARAGGGARKLRESGVEVVGPVFDGRRAVRENPAFHHTARHATPWVALKLATSLDGRIAAAPGVRTHLSGPEANREVHRLRAGFDAILVGGGTAWADDPRLTVREPVPMRRAPARIVLDSNAGLSPGAALFRDVDDAPVVVFTREDAPADARGRLEAAGARVHPVPVAGEAAGGEGRGRERAIGEGLDLSSVLRICREAGLNSILCEGGATLAGSLLRGGSLQRIHLFVTPHVLGERGVPAFRAVPAVRGARGSRGAGASPDGRAWILADPPRAFGEDVLLTYDRSPGGGSDPGSGSATRGED